ncbi:MAG: hypothetical protein AAGN66_13810 [Acidobacteriota bacterium]
MSTFEPSNNGPSMPRPPRRAPAGSGGLRSIALGSSLLLLAAGAASGQLFTTDHGYVTDNTGAQMTSVSPHVFKDTSGNWVMISQGPDSWGCSGVNDKIGYYTNTNANPKSGWVKQSRIGNCDGPGDYRTHGVGSVVHDGNYNAPFYLSVDHGKVTQASVNPDTEKHYVYLWESDNGRNWRNETLILDSSALPNSTLRTSLFRISSRSYYGSTMKTMKVGMFFNIGASTRSDVSIGYGYIDITYPGPGQQSTYDVYILVEDGGNGTYVKLPPDRKLTQAPKFVIEGVNPNNTSPTAPNRIQPNHVLVTDYFPNVRGELIATRMYPSTQALCCPGSPNISWKSEIQFFDFVANSNGRLLTSAVPLSRDGDTVVASGFPNFCNPRSDYFGVYYPMVVPPEQWMSGPDYMFTNVDDTCDSQGWGPFKVRLLEYQP